MVKFLVPFSSRSLHSADRRTHQLVLDKTRLKRPKNRDCAASGSSQPPALAGRRPRLGEAPRGARCHPGVSSPRPFPVSSAVSLSQDPLFKALLYPLSYCIFLTSSGDRKDKNYQRKEPRNREGNCWHRSHRAIDTFQPQTETWIPFNTCAACSPDLLFTPFLNR